MVASPEAKAVYAQLFTYLTTKFQDYAIERVISFKDKKIA